MKKLIDFIKGLFCKKCIVKAEAVIVKPSEEKKEALDKKKNLEKLAIAVKKKKNGN
jgi:Na+-transporting NADH:ubiquinone oxidoreductase subunit NqrC